MQQTRQEQSVRVVHPRPYPENEQRKGLWSSAHNRFQAQFPVMPSSSTGVRQLWIAGGDTVDNQSCCRKAGTLSEGAITSVLQPPGQQTGCRVV